MIREGSKRAGEAHVGQALKNSAKLADKQILHKPEMTNPHRTADGPPDGRAIDKVADSAVHEFKMANARPSIDLQRVRCEDVRQGEGLYSFVWFRFSSGLCPSARSWALSPYRPESELVFLNRGELEFGELLEADIISESCAKRRISSAIGKVEKWLMGSKFADPGERTAALRPGLSTWVPVLGRRSHGGTSIVVRKLCFRSEAKITADFTAKQLA